MLGFTLLMTLRSVPGSTVHVIVNRSRTNDTDILTTNLAAVVCVSVSVCAKVDQFLPKRSNFDSKRPEIFVRIATFPSATFGPLFSFHCPLFVTKNNNLEWKSSPASPQSIAALWQINNYI